MSGGHPHAGSGGDRGGPAGGEGPRRAAAADRTVPGNRTLVHETWGDHAALIARSRANPDGSVGTVVPQVMDVATPADPLPLELGGRLQRVAIAYETYGELNARGDNAVLVCHALTGSGHAAGRTDREEVPGWWDPLIGPGKAIDTRRYFVVSSNVLGGCYGSTGPSSVNPETGRAYAVDFPRYTVRDMVEAQRRLLDRLGVRKLAAAVGGSMGGMQVLEWAAMYPERVGAIAPIAIGARHSAWAIGLNEVARRAITSDPDWKDGRYPVDAQPERGLGLARAIAMLSYRSFDSLEQKFGRERAEAGRDLLGVSFEIESYLDYQGVKLVQRFDANTYLYLTRAMDDYDVAADRGKLGAVLSRMRMPVLVLGITSDVLYPEAEQKALAEALPSARYATVRSPHGHDAFLIEFPQVAAHLRRFLQEAA
ncbi:MAG TPA: homoserine O-acetyltransferase [Trueperaceae bacterium]|nr:homoserine O-acetyltransferase [Trueperaceae bacterium]